MMRLGASEEDGGVVAPFVCRVLDVLKFIKELKNAFAIGGLGVIKAQRRWCKHRKFFSVEIGVNFCLALDRICDQ